MRELIRFNAVAAIAKVTWIELLRDRILYSALFVGFLLILVGLLAANLTFIHPERVLLDIGLAAVTWTMVGLSFVLGANLLPKEIERRTFYVALSHPLSRTQFLIGKFLGLLAVLALNLVLLSLAFGLIFILAPGVLAPGMSLEMNPVIFGEALLFIWLQSMMMAACGLALSVTLAPMLSIFCSLGIYLIGNNVSQFTALAAQTEADGNPVSLGYRFFSKIWPNFEYFHLGTSLSYQLSIPMRQVLTGGIYGLVVMLLFLSLGALLIERKEI